MSAAVVTGRPADLTLRRAVSVALAVAAVVHVVVAPEHFAVWTAAGVFFLALAVVQIGLAARMVHGATVPPPAWLGLVVWVQVGAVVVWAWAHSLGLPFGPADHASHAEHGAEGHSHAVGGVGDGVPVLPGLGVEAPDALGILCVVAEVLAVLVAIQLLPSRTRRLTANAVLAVGVAGVGLWWASLG